MRIVYISHFKIPSRNANSIHVMNICNELSILGHEVYLLTPDWNDVEAADDVYKFYGVRPDFEIKKLYFPQKFRGGSSVYGLHVAKELRSLKPGLVIGRSVYGCAAAGLLDYPVVFDSHAPIWESGGLPLHLFRFMIGRKSFRKMTVNSGALKELYMHSTLFNHTVFNPERIQVLPNGANEYDLSEKTKLPGGTGSVSVGYFGHLYPGRGVDIILSLAGEMQGVDFYIGGGDEKDIRYWRSRVKSANVHFLGFIPHPEVYKYRNSCHILLAPYQRIASPEGGAGNQSPYMNPIKILEYMSSRKPIIASDLPTIREVLNEKNAMLVGCDDIAGWKQALNKLILDKTYANAIAGQAYDEFKKSYTWKARACKLIEL